MVKKSTHILNSYLIYCAYCMILYLLYIICTDKSTEYKRILPLVLSVHTLYLPFRIKSRLFHEDKCVSACYIYLLSFSPDSIALVINFIILLSILLYKYNNVRTTSVFNYFCFFQFTLIEYSLEHVLIWIYFSQ